MKAFIKETWLTKAFREFEKARLVRKIANQ